MSSSRSASRLLVGLIVAAVACVALTGCAHKTPAASASPRGVAAPSAATTTPSQPSAVLTPTAPATQLPAIAASSTLEPPSYVGFESLPSFTFHHVDPKMKNDIAIKPAMFESFLKLLTLLGYHTVSARDVIAHQTSGTPLPDKPVMITFDDGWRNQYTYAWPLLKKYGFTATFFINPQPISGHYGAYMTRDMVVTLAKAGNDIESHTWRHLAMTRTRKLTTEQFQKRAISELTRANKWIKAVAGQAPVAICYPYGYYDLETIGMAQVAGYQAGFSVDEGVGDARPWDAWAMKRMTINNTETLDSFKSRLLSGPLPVTDIQPAPGMRVVGIDTTVSVNITAVLANLTDLHLTGGPSMGPMTIVETGGQRYAQAVIHGGRAGFHAISMKATDPDGRAYYASWGIETGDKPH